MIWKKLTIDTSVEAVDLISEFLSELGVEGVMIEDNVPISEEDLEMMFVDIPATLGEDDGTAKVSCFVDDSFDINSLKADIAAELVRLEEFIDVGSKEISVTDTSDDSTWQNNWKQYFKPFRLYDNIVILPTWEEYEDIRPDDIVVSIESVMAFGTGTHETTKLCIGQLKKYLKENKKPDRREINRYILDNISYQLDDDAKESMFKHEKMIYEYLIDKVKINLENKKQMFESEERFNEFIRRSTLTSIDNEWVEEVDYLGQLQNAVTGRSTAQRNPVFEYQNDALESYRRMEDNVYKNIMRNVLLSTVTFDTSGKMNVTYP